MIVLREVEKHNRKIDASLYFLPICRKMHFRSNSYDLFGNQRRVYIFV